MNENDDVYIYIFNLLEHGGIFHHVMLVFRVCKISEQKLHREMLGYLEGF